MPGHAINQAIIFLPVLAVVFITIIAFARLAATRGRAAKARNDVAYYRAFIGPSEPEYAVVAVRHYANLFEVPVLFYGGCLSAFVLGGVSQWTLVWAWAYVVARAIQSFVHLSYNNPMHRGMPFALGWLFIIALWIDVAIIVAMRLA
ncbi:MULTISPECIES: MAPEG family protein [Sphingobium]|nr:MAPEG family protein [Sphingobium fuliginis]QDC39023.1 hypothetical protein FIL70_04035 [Sphingobium fuliginis ATCC 27551]